MDRPSHGQHPGCSHPIKISDLVQLTEQYGRTATSTHIPDGAVRFTIAPDGAALLTLSDDDRDTNRRAVRIARKLGRVKGI